MISATCVFGLCPSCWSKQDLLCNWVQTAVRVYLQEGMVPSALKVTVAHVISKKLVAKLPFLGKVVDGTASGALEEMNSGSFSVVFVLSRWPFSGLWMTSRGLRMKVVHLPLPNYLSGV